MYSTIKIIIVIILVVFIIQQMLSNNSAKNTETPAYKILKKFENFEIREYPQLIMATTKLGDSYGKNSGNGFRTVASYIFGGNQTSEKISMTAPVIVEMSDTMKMSFIMPAAYTMDQLPQPNSSQVVLHEELSKIVAVIAYSGFSNDKKMEAYQSRLQQELQRNNLTPAGPFMYYGYNPPYQLTNRRNEIAVEVQWRKE